MLGLFCKKTRTVKYYPTFQVKDQLRREFDLPRACRVLRQRFPYLNPEGLAQVQDLSVHVKSEPFKNFMRHVFYVFNAADQENVQPKIGIGQNYRGKKIELASFYPDLPPGERLGLTLLFLILTRGNSFAGWKVDIPVASFPMKDTLDHMTDFKPRNGWLISERVLKVPKLSAEEAAAVEWFWVNVLHCPVM
jgi:hypothetical protein